MVLLYVLPAAIHDIYKVLGLNATPETVKLAAEELEGVLPLPLAYFNSVLPPNGNLLKMLIQLSPPLQESEYQRSGLR